MKILVVHGPNLNLLGLRDPDIYGQQTLPEVNKTIAQFAMGRGADVDFFQSNHEGEIIDRIQQTASRESVGRCDALVINPGAFTHYSYAIRDAIEAVAVRAIEVHLSDIHNREEFRRHSVIAEVCEEQISGLGVQSYLRAIEKLTKKT